MTVAVRFHLEEVDNHPKNSHRATQQGSRHRGKAAEPRLCYSKSSAGISCPSGSDATSGADTSRAVNSGASCSFTEKPPAADDDTSWKCNAL
mmetsp:Transcript_13088/g.29767  ORF Transcript_13088/g.29767 Transcript_13088/m.29767 type:complete len:92 (-) Transcript_13088:1577-1852(-)